MIKAKKLTIKETSLNASQQYVIQLLRKATDNQALLNNMDEGLCTDDFVGAIGMIIRQNGILLTVYQLLEKENNPLAKLLIDNLKVKYLAAIRQSILQEYEGQLLLDAMNDNEMDCIALKGWVMRKLYPKTTMRSMADMDILFRDYDYKKLSTVMKELGYSANERESDWMHDNFTKLDCINIEAHKRLTDDTSVMKAWEKRMWDRAVKEPGHEHLFLMSDEDYYIYHFIHMFKDFKYGQLGLRRLTDTWIYNQAHPDMDNDYISAAFSDMGMSLFHERIINLTKVIFEEQPMDENSEILLKHAMDYGIYGTDKTYKIGRVASMSENSMTAGKLKSWTAAVFLPYKRMKAHYPILQKYPVLLPFCWAKRITGHLRNLPKYKKMMDYSNLTKEDYDEMKSFFKAGGLE